jgi:hypothetical protein
MAVTATTLGAIGAGLTGGARVSGAAPIGVEPESDALGEGLKVMGGAAIVSVIGVSASAASDGPAVGTGAAGAWVFSVWGWSAGIAPAVSGCSVRFCTVDDRSTLGEGASGIGGRAALADFCFDTISEGLPNGAGFVDAEETPKTFPGLAWISGIAAALAEPVGVARSALFFSIAEISWDSGGLGDFEGFAISPTLGITWFEPTGGNADRTALTGVAPNTGPSALGTDGTDCATGISGSATAHAASKISSVDGLGVASSAAV